MQKSVLLPRIGMCLDYVPNFVSLERRSSLDKGLSKEKFHCILVGGLSKGYQNCDVVTGDTVLPNVSTLMHVFSAILT